MAAGKCEVELEDFDLSYALYADGVKVASFAEGRVGYREWALRSGRLEYVHSLDDRSTTVTTTTLMSSWRNVNA